MDVWIRGGAEPIFNVDDQLTIRLTLLTDPAVGCLELDGCRIVCFFFSLAASLLFYFLQKLFS